jgi:hypothetical protein
VIVSTHVRMRSKVAEQAIRDNLVGKLPGDADYDVLLTGPTKVTSPSGAPLCVYLPGALTAFSQDPAVYDVLHSLRSVRTDNRALASGSRLLPGGGNQTHVRAMSVPSAIIGASDAISRRRYCRLTSWTGANLPQWETLRPMLQAVAARLAEHVPDRYASQAAVADKTDPAWVVPGTPFTTVTVNNTFPTGCHTDKGDLDEGFSTIGCLRRGAYTGGRLVFPAYRVAVDMQDGDLILMDAHQWHGNTPIVCACGTRPAGPCRQCGSERISLVSYYRTKVAECGSPEQETARAAITREKA